MSQLCFNFINRDNTLMFCEPVLMGLSGLPHQSFRFDPSYANNTAFIHTLPLKMIMVRGYRCKTIFCSGMHATGLFDRNAPLACAQLRCENICSRFIKNFKYNARRDCKTSKKYYDSLDKSRAFDRAAFSRLIW
mgnify:FL=1